ncbi:MULTISPECIES: hypothetical protein [unclassified Actinobaculum]|uniref:hypothetical protein n=1 Tax=unclassified Actinobaculum TaxID=2609299 RepID=UPI000D52983C|nr:MULTISPECIES: hypothetical protein [unclassified Actinobaculum]AWE42849.1 hypothetical protein DDD63_08965 [Actinobaculum sp. 313]RTE49071.1 hypothetical protein EKN07_08060 [Actinobaculum sp. 352]
MRPKPVDIYALKRAASLTAAAAMILAMCHYVTRIDTSGIALRALPYIASGVALTAITAPILFALFYHQDRHSLLRTIGWSWAASIAAIITVWSLYGIILINLGYTTI